MKPHKPNFKKAKEKMERIMKGARKHVKPPPIGDIFKNKKGRTFNYVKELKETDELIMVRLKGVIDTYTLPIIKAEHDSEIKENLDKHILLDFKDVTHVDSATLASLIQLLNELKMHNKKLGITNATFLLKNYLGITRLESMVHIYETEKAALKDLMQKVI